MAECEHRTTAVVYAPSRFQVEVRCADCELLLAYLTDEAIQRRGHAAIRRFAKVMDIRPEVIEAARRRR